MSSSDQRSGEVYEVTDKTKVRRAPERGRYEREFVHEVLDEALICHVGFAVDGQPFVIPTIHARVDEILYLHGSVGSRMMKTAASGEPLCVTVTILDGLVLARSAFHHSMNYRSAVVIGSARAITERSEKLVASEAISEHIWRGRWDDTRHPNELELRKTAFVALDLTEVSAKTRSGPPGDDEADYELSHWAGVMPVVTRTLEPEADPLLSAEIELPDYLKGPRPL